MGDYSVSCALTGIPLKNQWVKLVALAPAKHCDGGRSHPSVRPGAVTADPLFKPVLLALTVRLDDYGAFSDIAEDKHTAFLEKRFKITSKDIADAILEGDRVWGLYRIAKRLHVKKEELRRGVNWYGDMYGAVIDNQAWEHFSANPDRMEWLAEAERRSREALKNFKNMDALYKERCHLVYQKTVMGDTYCNGRWVINGVVKKGVLHATRIHRGKEETKNETVLFSKLTQEMVLGLKAWRTEAPTPYSRTCSVGTALTPEFSDVYKLKMHEQFGNELRQLLMIDRAMARFGRAWQPSLVSPSSSNKDGIKELGEWLTKRL